MPSPHVVVGKQVPAERVRRRRRRRIVLAMFAGALVGAELLVRATFGAPPVERLPVLTIRANAYRGWEMLPSTTHYTYEHPVAVNSIGLRGPEVGAKQPGVVRVLAVGASYVYGQGVADADTVPARLEAELNAVANAGRRWEVVNCGHRAYGSHQLFGLLRELGPRLEPDVVVLFWNWKVLGGPDVEATRRRLEASGPIAFDVKAKMAGSTEVRWRAKQLLRRSALLMVAQDLWAAAFVEGLEDGVAERGMARLASGFEAYAGIPFGGAAPPALVFAVIPDRGALVGSHPTDAWLEEASALAAAAGHAVLPLRDALRRCAEQCGELPVLRYDWHYDARANAAIAARTAAFLLDGDYGK